MRKISLIITFVMAFCYCIPVNSQTWKTKIQKTTGRERMKTLRLKPGYDVTIGHLASESDSIKIARYFSGTFSGSGNESIFLNIKQLKSQKTFSDGRQLIEILPAKALSMSAESDTSHFAVNLEMIHTLRYSSPLSEWVEIGEPVILLSLATLILSPAICFNFMEGTFNTERYQYWALGSTIGLAAGFTTIITLGTLSSGGKYQFKPGWPSQKAKVWRFTPKTP